jgi:tRNA nucleotidyltransferase/poly(A) polymerase
MNFGTKGCMYNCGDSCTGECMKPMDGDKVDMFKFYEVGGKVRDEILGLQSKDVDYVAVPEDDLIKTVSSAHTMFNVLSGYLKQEGFEVFLETPDCFTIRAKFPADHKHSGVADFVMARKEIGYIPGTRTPIIQPGTLYDDLERRDFTLNALAKDDEGNIIDFFDGMTDLKKGLLRTPLPCEETFHDDPLRILRAIRFSITKGFTIPEEMAGVIANYDYEVHMAVVSEERIREELYKCFKHDTHETIKKLWQFPFLMDYIFRTRIWLKPTLEQ